MRVKSLARWLDATHALLGRSDLLSRGARKLGNQCAAIVRKHLETPLALETDEVLIRHLAGGIDSFVDVGGNRGDWTRLVVASNPDYKQGMIFEPSRRCWQQLHETFGSTGRLAVIPRALGRTPGEAVFFEDVTRSYGSSLAGVQFPDSQIEQYPVQVSTLDVEAGPAFSDGIDFLKIDAEGTDLDVLHGASALFDARRVNIVQFEYTPFWLEAGHTLCGAVDFLQRRDLQIFLLRASGLHEFSYRKWGEFFGNSIFIAVHPRRFDLVRGLVGKPI